MDTYCTQQYTKFAHRLATRPTFRERIPQSGQQVGVSQATERRRHFRQHTDGLERCMAPLLGRKEQQETKAFGRQIKTFCNYIHLGLAPGNAVDPQEERSIVFDTKRFVVENVSCIVNETFRSHLVYLQRES